MKIDSLRYGINRPKCRHGQKYSKYMKRLSICIKQQTPKQHLKLSL